MTDEEERNIVWVESEIWMNDIPYSANVDYWDGANRHITVPVPDDLVDGKRQSVTLWPEGPWVRMDAFLSRKNAANVALYLNNVIASDELFAMAVMAEGYAEGEA